MKKEVKIQIIYSEKLCGETFKDNFTWCPLVDNDLGQYCILYKKQLKTNVDRHPYRCSECLKRNKVS